MSTQHTDLFHCLKCGRIAYEPQDHEAPFCCDQPMVRAVADVDQGTTRGEGNADGGSQIGRAGEEHNAALADHALFAEAVELSNWSRTMEDVDISRYEELAQRLEELHEALCDRFQDESESVSGRPGAPLRKLLGSIERLVATVLSQEPIAGSWETVCRQLESLVEEFRSVEKVESDTARSSRDGARPA